MAKLCYYCGAFATSREHVPPKQMFKGFVCDSITVYACDEHNSEKSGYDHAVITGLLTSLANMQKSSRRYSLSVDVIRAINVAEANFHRSKRYVTSKSILTELPDQLIGLPKAAYINRSANILDWMRQLTAALVMTATRSFDPSIDWTNALAFSFDYWNFSGPVDYADILERHNQVKLVQSYFQQLPWLDGWSARPKPYPRTIYYFQLHFDSQQNDIIFRHRFYDAYTWFVRFAASESTKEALRRMSGSTRR